MLLRLYVLLLIVFEEFTGTHESEHDRVIITCHIDFDIFVSRNEQFCNGTKTLTNTLMNGVYFQYITSNRTWPWITVDIYYATTSVKENLLEFQSNDVQFRWIQYNTIGSPSWAIDSIIISCPAENIYKSVSFEENPDVFNKNFDCHSGFLQRGVQSCSDTEYSLLLNDTNRELRTISFDLVNDTTEGVQISDRCQPQVCLGPSLSHGLVWSTTLVNETVRIQCSRISEIFWSGLDATRKCLDGGVWDEVDMSQCTIKDTDGIPFIVYSTYLQTPANISSPSTLNQLCQSLDVYSISVTVNELYIEEKHFLEAASSVTLAVYIVTFNNDILAEENDDITDTANHLVTVKLNYSITVFQGFPEVVIMHPVDVCQCKNSFTIENEQQSITVVNVCAGISIPPCISDDSDIGSKCNEPHYTGNVTHCDIPITDNVYDCSQEIDLQFGIRWEGARKNSNATGVCPNGTGNTSRLCDSLGNWHVPDVRSCSSTIYQNLFERICNITARTININELSSFLMSFAEIFDQTNFSMFPLDLKTINNIMEKLFIATEKNSTILKLGGTNITEGLLTIFDSIFDGKNEPGFKQLIEIDRTENQMLIVQSEKLGMLLATNTDIENGELTETNFTRKHFVLSVQRSDVRDITFRPQLNENDQTSFHIPAQLLEQKPKDANGMVPVVYFVYKTLHKFLPDTLSLNYQVKETVSMIISSQVGSSHIADKTTDSLLPRSNPITLKFDHNAPDNMSNITRCAFWNFDLPHTGGDGGWDSTDVIVAEESRDGHITCHSFHLTCFVVLVDVSGGSGGLQGTGESTALSIVTYIGCGISIICLLVAIVILIIYRNTLLKGVHNFVHLNLSVALLLALIVFVAGIETATNNQAACTVVAALLHYLFTSVFSWMLCEGILMYVLLVKVFGSKFTRKMWPYFILGWGIPMPIVAISAGIAHRHYGNNEFCWVSTDGGAIWAFVGPMLLIILVNTIILIMVLQVLFKCKSQKMTSNDEAKQVDVVKSLMKATIVLLPLLGVTWVFGILAVNKNLSVFAWIFTVLNSIQGLLILLFHVLRHLKVSEIFWTAVVGHTASSKSQVSSTTLTYSVPSKQDKAGDLVDPVKNIEQYDGDATEPVDGVKTINDSSCYSQTVRTYSSEEENSQIPSPVTDQI